MLTGIYLTEDLRYISTGYILTLPTANLPNASDSQTTYTITEVISSKQVGFTSPATAQKTVKADKATQDEIEQRLARLSVGNSGDQEVYAMHVKTEVSFANTDDERTAGDDGKNGDARTKAMVKRSNRNTSNPALPSYINIYPPGPLNSTSESFSAYATLGGLSKHIAQVRSLLDLPLSQP